MSPYVVPSFFVMLFSILINLYNDFLGTKIHILFIAIFSHNCAFLNQ